MTVATTRRLLTPSTGISHGDIRRQGGEELGVRAIDARIGSELPESSLDYAGNMAIQLRRQIAGIEGLHGIRSNRE